MFFKIIYRTHVEINIFFESTKCVGGETTSFRTQNKNDRSLLQFIASPTVLCALIAIEPLPDVLR